MLKTKVIRAFGLVASAELWRRAGSVHPFGEHFNPLVDFVPDHYDRRTMEDAIAVVPDAVMTGPGISRSAEFPAGRCDQPSRAHRRGVRRIMVDRPGLGFSDPQP